MLPHDSTRKYMTSTMYFLAKRPWARKSSLSTSTTPHFDPFQHSEGNIEIIRKKEFKKYSEWPDVEHGCPVPCLLINASEIFFSNIIIFYMKSETNYTQSKHSYFCPLLMTQVDTVLLLSPLFSIFLCLSFSFSCFFFPSFLCFLVPSFCGTSLISVSS